jgi:hypothetical protein
MLPINLQHLLSTDELPRSDDMPVDKKTKIYCRANSTHR